MRRRQFITLLGVAAAWPLAARAQQSAMPVIGLLGSESPTGFPETLGAFHRGLSELDYVEGRSVRIEYRWAENRYERLPALAADLVGRQVTIIVAMTQAAALAAKAASTTIPIVFNIGSDPVTSGLVASLNRPGGNVTGVSFITVALGPKRLELVRELVPNAALIGVLVNPSNPNAEDQATEAREAARRSGRRIQVLSASSEDELEPAFATLVKNRAGALLVSPDPFLTSRRDQLVRLAARHAVPTIYAWREFAEIGGLMSYGTSLTDAYRQVGIYAGKILKGVKPADLPVQQSTKVELVINLKTAKTLGLTIPLPLLGRADEVIE